MNDLWEAATLLNIKSIKIILDGFFTQSQISTLDDTLDALVQDLHETDNASSSCIDKNPSTDVVEDIQMELIDALIPIVPVVVLPSQNKPMSDSDESFSRNLSRDKISKMNIPVVNLNFHKQAGIDSKKRVIKNTGINQKRSLQSLSMLREKALEYQKELEAAIRECKKGMSLEDACELYSVSKEALFRNIKNFKLAHIKPPSPVNQM